MSIIISVKAHQQEVGLGIRLERRYKGRHSSSIVMVELESRSLSVVLLLEKAFKAPTVLDGLRTATGVCCLSQDRVKVWVSLRQLSITLLHMLMCGEILSGEVWPHVIKLGAWTISTHSKSILKWVSTDSCVNRMSSLERRCWLAYFLHSPIIATGRWTGIFILHHKAASNSPRDTCNLRFIVLIKLALGCLPKGKE